MQEHSKNKFYGALQVLHCDLVCRHVIRYQRFRARLQRLGIEFSCANPDCGGFLFGLGRSLSNLGIVVSFHCYPPGFFSPYCWLCRGERGVKQQINKHCVGSHIESFVGILCLSVVYECLKILVAKMVIFDL